MSSLESIHAAFPGTSTNQQPCIINFLLLIFPSHLSLLTIVLSWPQVDWSWVAWKKIDSRVDLLYAQLLDVCRSSMLLSHTNTNMHTHTDTHMHTQSRSIKSYTDQNQHRVQCCYNVSIFYQNPHKRWPKSPLESELFGVFCDFEVWLMFCIRCCIQHRIMSDCLIKAPDCNCYESSSWNAIILISPEYGFIIYVMSCSK